MRWTCGQMLECQAASSHRAALALSHGEVPQIVVAAVLALFQTAPEFRHTRRELYRPRRCSHLGASQAAEVHSE